MALGLASVPVLACLACSSLPPHPEPDATTQGFSLRVAEAHLAALTGLRPRLPGSREDTRARRYIARELRLAGAELQETLRSEAGHLIGRVSGASRDRVLLVVPYAALGEAGWVDDAGAALCLELARAFAAEPPPYDVVLALAAVQPAPLEEGEGRWQPVVDAVEARERVAAAGEDLLGRLRDAGGLDDLRAVVVLEPRARRSPRIARDLRSHPVFRSLFWETAASLGHGAAFPAEAAWSSSVGLQGAFHAAGLGQVLALVDESAGRVELETAPSGGSPGGWASDPSALEPVGRVTLESLDRLMQRLERIDAFSK